jgi:hypothetical protein
MTYKTSFDEWLATLTDSDKEDFLRQWFDGQRKRDEAAPQPAIGLHNISRSEGGRAYVSEFFSKRLRRHDFGRYIRESLAADFACALAGYLREHDAAAPAAPCEHLWGAFPLKGGTEACVAKCVKCDAAPSNTDAIAPTEGARWYKHIDAEGNPYWLHTPPEAPAVDALTTAKPIYQLRLATGDWRDQDEGAYRYNAKHCPKDVRIVYAHPTSEPKALTKVMIGKAWRDCGALSDSPPDWALSFAQNIARALLHAPDDATASDAESPAPVAWATTYGLPATTTVRMLADMNPRQREYVMRYAQKVVALAPVAVLKDEKESNNG